MNQSPAPRDYFILIVLSLIWGTSYILIKKALLVFTPYQVAGLRLGISALAFTPLIIHHLKKVKRRQIPLFLAVGLCGTGLPSFLYPAAQVNLSSSVAGILSSLTPLFTFILAWLAFGLRVYFTQGVGILVGLAGAILLTLAGSDGGGALHLGYAGLVILATVCYATSSNLVKAYFQGTPALTITVVAFFLVGLPALIWSLTSGGVVNTVLEHPHGWWGLGYVSILALFSTVLASIIFFWLVQQTSAVFGSTVSYLVPLVAVGWGLADNERIGWAQLLAFLLILVGIYLSRGKKT